MGTKRFIVWVAAFSILALPVFAPAAEKGHDMDLGEKIFSGKVGPWTAEARLVDMKAQMEKSGVSAKTAAKFAGTRHLMLFVTDPATGKTAAGVSGKVEVTGPDKASSSKVTLVVMGEHIGADVGMPTPGSTRSRRRSNQARRKEAPPFPTR